VIRNVVLIKLKPGTPPEAVEGLRQALEKVDSPGRRSFSMGMDAGLRDGNVDVAIVGDFDDEDAYRAYDADPEHNRIRRELLAPIAERVERCQYRI
jgi:hypothetical protein